MEEAVPSKRIRVCYTVEKHFWYEVDVPLSRVCDWDYIEQVVKDAVDSLEPPTEMCIETDHVSYNIRVINGVGNSAIVFRQEVEDTPEHVIDAVSSEDMDPSVDLLWKIFERRLTVDTEADSELEAIYAYLLTKDSSRAKSAWNSWLDRNAASC